MCESGFVLEFALLTWYADVRPVAEHALVARLAHALVVGVAADAFVV